MVCRTPGKQTKKQQEKFVFCGLNVMVISLPYFVLKFPACFVLGFGKGWLGRSAVRSVFPSEDRAVLSNMLTCGEKYFCEPGVVKGAYESRRARSYCFPLAASHD